MKENSSTSEGLKVSSYFYFCGEALAWKSIFSSGLSINCVKMFCFDGFIFLTFLSDVIVNGQTVQFFGTIVVAIKPRKINVVLVCSLSPGGGEITAALRAHCPFLYGLCLTRSLFY